MRKHPNTRIVHGEHFADIIVRYDDSGPVYYWICQTFGSAEIVGMGTTRSFEDAEHDANQCLEQLARGERCSIETFDEPHRAS